MLSSPSSLPQRSAKSDYRPEIDGLRALAVSLVVAYHAFPTLIPAGFIGVDVFFVISGYLISGIILRAIEQKRFSISEFYARRFRRILPALCVMMAVIWAAGWIVLLPKEFGDLGKQLIAGTGFVENIFLMKQAGYFDAEAMRKPMLHLWSLGVEEQFYFFWPLVLVIIARLRGQLGIIMLGLIALSFAACVYYGTAYPVETFYLLPTRFWELLCGALLVHAERAEQSHPRLNAFLAKFATPFWQNVKSTIAVTGVITFAAFFKSGAFFIGWSAIVPCIGAVLFISAGNNAWLNRAVFSASPIVFLGRISFPLYLWHWPLLSLLTIMENGQPSAHLVVGAMVVAVALSAITYLFVELPLQAKFDFKNGLKPIFTASIRAMIVTALLGYAASTYNKPLIAALPAWLTNAEIQHVVDEESFQRTTDTEWWTNANLSNDATCPKSAWLGKHNPDYCRLTHPEPRVAILGDSHANHLVPGLEALKDKVLSRVIQISFGGCVAFRGVYFHQRLQTEDIIKDCYSGNQDFKDAVIKDKAIGLVMISMKGYGNENFDDRYPDQTLVLGTVGYELNPQLSKVDVLREGLSRTISEFEKAGKKVVYVMDVPDMETSPVDCVLTRKISFEHTHLPSCTTSRDLVEHQQQKDMRQMVADLKRAHPRMVVFDPVPELCDASVCSVIHENKMLYRDKNHLSVDGSELIAKAIARALNN